MAHYKVEICGINTSKLPLLSNEEKKTLFDKIKKGDKKAREAYIHGNLRLIKIKPLVTSGNFHRIPLSISGKIYFLYIRAPHPASYLNRISRHRFSRAPVSYRTIAEYSAPIEWG